MPTRAHLGAVLRGLAALTPRRWDFAVHGACIAAAVASSLLVTLLLVHRFQAQLDREDLRRGATLLQWMVTDAERGTLAGSVPAAHEPGVAFAVVLAKDGRVRVPMSRATESYPVIPVLAVAADAVRDRRVVRDATSLHLVQPIPDRAGGLPGVAWLVMRRSRAVAGLLWVAGVAALLGLVIGVLIACWLQRTTEAFVMVFDTGVRDRVFGGTSPLPELLPGTPAGRAVATNVTLLLERLHDPRRQGVPPVVG